jgi:recombination protein RecA
VGVTVNGTSMASLTSSFKEQYGEEIGGQGYKYQDVFRYQTGILAVDVALGGGIPGNRVTEIYGGFSCCKSNLASKIIKHAQRDDPDRYHAWIDMEKVFDPNWEKAKGVDVDGLFVFRPETVEQVVDMTESLLLASDCGVVVLDSAAAMVTQHEIESSATKADTGSTSIPIRRMVNKVTVSMSQANKAGRSPTFIIINQTRYKIGAMGDPETTPGGGAPKYAASLRLRLYATPVMDEKVSTELPVRKKVNVLVKKHKVPIVAKQAEFEMAMFEHKGLRPGDTNDMPLLLTYMEKHGTLKDVGKSKWEALGETWKTLKSLKERIEAEEGLYDHLKRQVIQTELKKVYKDQVNDPVPYVSKVKHAAL